MAPMTLPVIICPLPGCKAPTSEVGVPCEDCRALFGEAIQQSTRELDPEQFQLETAAGERRLRQIMAERTGEVVRVRNQTCWMCQERRTCARVHGRWECDLCREVL